MLLLLHEMAASYRLIDGAISIHSQYTAYYIRTYVSTHEEREKSCTQKIIARKKRREKCINGFHNSLLLLSADQCNIGRYMQLLLIQQVYDTHVAYYYQRLQTYQVYIPTSTYIHTHKTKWNNTLSSHMSSFSHKPLTHACVYVYLQQHTHSTDTHPIVEVVVGIQQE